MKDYKKQIEEILAKHNYFAEYNLGNIECIDDFMSLLSQVRKDVLVEVEERVNKLKLDPEDLGFEPSLHEILESLALLK